MRGSSIFAIGVGMRRKKVQSQYEETCVKCHRLILKPGSFYCDKCWAKMLGEFQRAIMGSIKGG